MKKIILFILLMSFCQVASARNGASFEQMRDEMVSKQIEARGIKDRRVLRAMRKVPRHEFIPLNIMHLAYKDSPLPIGNDQTISQPYIVGRMTELLELDGNERILEIGTGSGYQTAILAELARDVYTVEIIPELADRAKETLRDLGHYGVKVKCGDGYLGWPEHAPFDGIIVTCAPEEVPQALIDQLDEGGRLVIPVGSTWQQLTLIKKVDGKIEKESIIPVRFVPMIHGE